MLLVIFDQWSGNRLGVAGHPVVETPTIDQKAGPANFITTIASFFGSCFAILCLAAFSPAIDAFALE